MIQKQKKNFENIKKAIKDLQEGKFIIIIDEKYRENEGDLVLAAEKATPSKLNFMIKKARGLMCFPCEEKILNRLRIPMMIIRPTDKFQTPFTVSVDAKRNTKTGISVFDRMEALKLLLDPKSKKSDFTMPGHSFPLKAKRKLFEERKGHTEATITMLKLAGLKPVGVISEILADDGSSATLSYLKKFSKKYNIKIVSISEIISYSREIASQKIKI